MSYIEQFLCQLRKSEAAYPMYDTGNALAYMLKKQQEISNILKNAKVEKPNPLVIQQTLEKLLRHLSGSNEAFSWLELAFLCWGLNNNIVNFSEKTILSSNKGFKAFQTLLHDAKQRGTFTAYLWQGLWFVFLNFNDRSVPIARQNWECLRKDLRDSLPDLLTTMKFIPLWLEAVERYPIIFEPDLTQKLAQQALSNSYAVIQRMAEELNIPSTSWFWPDLLYAQITIILTYPDDAFKSYLNPLIEQLSKHSEYLDTGLAQLLDRYAKSSDDSVHSELKSLVVQRWKSPALEKQREWERVKPETKTMVQRWLVREDIQDIFQQLVDDHRRYEFWMQFIDQIDYTFVWLGSYAQRAHPHLLKSRIDRCSSLSGTKAENNALLMKIGKVYIVESGAVAGGKCWAYPSELITPLLQRRTIDYQSLRNPYKCLWHTLDGLAHVGKWEHNFLEALGYLRITPTLMNFEELIARYQIKVETLPSRCELIRHKYGVGTLANELNKHGFIYNFQQNGFYRNLRMPSGNS